MAFFGGSTGVLYRQFSVTLIASMLLSVAVALILTPVLCASFLKPVKAGHEPAENAIPFLRPFFLWFDRVFFRTRDRYVKAVERSFSKKLRYVIIYIVIVAAVGIFFIRMPTGYVPDEDQGTMLAQIMLPRGATREQTDMVVDQVERYFRENEKEAVESCMTISGVGFSGTAQNNGIVFIMLKDWKLRNRSQLRVKAIAERASKAFSQFRNSLVFVFPPPAIVELDIATGFSFELMDRGGLGHEKLMAARNQLLGMASKDTRLIKVRPNGLEDVSQYRVDVDWGKAGALGVPISSIHSTIAQAFGSAYVNDFIQGGRIKRVWVQADAPYRMLPKDIERLYVRNTAGRMVPFSSLASGYWTSGSPRLERYNAFPSMNIQGEAAPGKSSGEAMQAMEEIVAKLPQGIGFEWTGLSYQERMSSSQGPLLYAFSIIVIFLCLAALYESWSIPISILLVLPLGIFGAALATWIRGMYNDVYFQIGFLTTLGLTTKNAILIAQFAKERMAEGIGLIEATVEAARLRLRPIIMTSLAFFFGVLPLAIATGAGAGAMKAIGTAVAGGMLTATLIAIFYIPLFFVIVSRIFKGKQPDNGLDPTPFPKGDPKVPPSPGASPEIGYKPDPTNSSEGRSL
jgi:HAE1 family hydrophobic/amphiphilic exporter-1